MPNAKNRTWYWILETAWLIFHVGMMNTSEKNAGFILNMDETVEPISSLNNNRLTHNKHRGWFLTNKLVLRAGYEAQLMSKSLNDKRATK